MVLRILPVTIFLTCLNLQGQSSNSGRRVEYFQKYYVLAIEEMIRSGIPASITLAQGALESGDGNSRLARQANNHFGIKCHDDWNGRTIKHDDDSRNECFRSYNSVEDSYRDHSDFLNGRQRYAFLFELEPTDYKGWARGLKNAGYATSRDYASALIKIIEDYNLQQYDLIALNDRGFRGSSHISSSSLAQRQIMENNRVKYIITKEGDNFPSLANDLEKMLWELPRYNDLTPYDSLGAGRIIYLQPKRNKAEMGNKTHIVKSGETMFDISQLYAVKLDRLYDLNRMPYGTEPEAGAVLQLRKALKIKEPAGEADEPDIRVTEDEVEMEFDLGL
ncbi:MAG: glucosaminidase domain-containing protein [Bacteroidales bacterium]|nr:glucosaminidase domain-containing protein [Bacteroidales bacterium]